MKHSYYASSATSRIRSFSLLFFLLFLVTGGVLAQDRVVRLLAIGNSFSEDAVEQHLHELAAERGITLIIGNMYIGGCSLERHVQNARNNAPAYAYRKIGADGVKREYPATTLAEALADERWDYVSLQQVSQNSGLYDTYEASLPELMAYVRARLPYRFQLILHQTWAYAANSTHTGFANYGNDQLQMYHAIAATTRKVSRHMGIGIVIPAGTAIQNARTSFVGDSLTRDGYHLDLRLGRYIAARTWCEKLFPVRRGGKNAAYVPDGIDTAHFRVAVQAARRAVRRPYRISSLAAIEAGQ